MTEEEWLAEDWSFEEILGRGDVPVSERKTLLFVCACVRQVWGLLVDRRCQQAVEIVERFADRQADEEAVHHAWVGAWEVRFLNVAGPADLAAELTTRLPPSPQNVVRIARLVRTACAQELDRRQSQGGRPVTPFDVERQARAYQEQLFHDLVANPYRPCRIDRHWLKWNASLIPRLAEDIYQERRFHDLPVLADALEDAGCTEALLLDHCRQPIPHLRGCWVVDAITGRR